MTTKKKTEKKYKHNPKVWLVTVDMGYGHQRATYPLRKIAYKGVINANTYKGIPVHDRKIWQDQRKFYEFVSRFKRIPLLGEVLFNFMDYFQKIPKFYPKRDLSKPSLQIMSITHLAKDDKWGKHLIKKLSEKPLPLVTSFFTTAVMAEVHNYPGEIYLIICDADISRAWVSVKPSKTRIHYFAPNLRVVERLKLYGVGKSKIHLTGFPLPESNLGSDFRFARMDLKHRLVNLDPLGVYVKKYKSLITKHLKIKNLPKRSNHILTLTFAVGGAGAQRELGEKIVKGLKDRVIKGQLRINLIAGVHSSVNSFFKEVVKKNGLTKYLGDRVEILYDRDKQKYFEKFNKLLRQTDILWTKPSELSFYCGLGLPILIAPPIGSQEFFNERWLVNLGAGIKQEDPDHVNQWLFDWVESGRLAEAAFQGFLEAPKMGTYNIKRILAHETEMAHKLKTISQY